ncbi:MAG TPA: hypothetical protein VKE93_12275 [Candidatus Angelobacter sp.]|nr:hypothetical protein [Candidatus Angelobacter sp.]
MRQVKHATALAFVLCTALAQAQLPTAVQNATGMRLLVDEANTQPVLRIVLPGRPDNDRAIEVLFPEHVTARKTGAAEGEHFYVFRPGTRGERPAWRKSGQSLEYERDFGGVHMLARATLEDDGIRFHYEFANRSNTAYDMIYAVTDPRLTSIFHDERLERTYVHHKDGFDLLASETPARLTMPMNQWLPNRYAASYTWPVPPKLVERSDDGITHYNKLRPVDQPLIATLSTDRQWVVASFTRQTGNVWSNPELTCQHVDPQTSLAPGQRATLELKILIVKASLDQVLTAAKQQRNTLR